MFRIKNPLAYLKHVCFSILRRSVAKVEHFLVMLNNYQHHDLNQGNLIILDDYFPKCTDGVQSC